MIERIEAQLALPCPGVCVPGRLAQLVEHLLYTQGVGGSSPSPPIAIVSLDHPTGDRSRPEALEIGSGQVMTGGSGAPSLDRDEQRSQRDAQSNRRQKYAIHPT